jgi:hypothetical protein
LTNGNSVVRSKTGTEDGGCLNDIFNAVVALFFPEQKSFIKSYGIWEKTYLISTKKGSIFGRMKRT